jgi:uncharacterized protein YydD (DUF2326 family)
LYSNKPELFEPIAFRSGLNVVLGEIRLPENKKKDTHNLGKTTLGSLIDFCLLAGRDPRFFLFKHQVGCTHFVRQKVKTLPWPIEKGACLRLDRC